MAMGMAIKLRTLFWRNKTAGIKKVLTNSSRVANSSSTTSITATRTMITAVLTATLATTLTRAANIKRKRRTTSLHWTRYFVHTCCLQFAGKRDDSRKMMRLNNSVLNRNPVYTVSLSYQCTDTIAAGSKSPEPEHCCQSASDDRMDSDRYNPTLCLLQSSISCLLIDNTVSILSQHLHQLE